MADHDEEPTVVVPPPPPPEERASIDREPILKYFVYQHLRADLQPLSRTFADMAGVIMELPRCAERTVALRKLLEAKDAAVRAKLETPKPASESTP